MGKTERLEAMKRRQVDGPIEQPQDTQISGSMFIAGKTLNSQKLGRLSHAPFLSMRSGPLNEQHVADLAALRIDPMV